MTARSSFGGLPSFLTAVPLRVYDENQVGEGPLLRAPGNNGATQGVTREGFGCLTEP
jgi:hypothetical protein